MLTLAEGLMSETLSTLRRCGAGRNECVVYWTASLQSPDMIDGTLHPEHLAGPSFYEVTAGWLNQTWVALARGERTIRAQVHTHSGPAFHSASDDGFPVVQQAGFLSLVLPNHARGDDLSGAYLTRLGTDGRWHAITIDEGLGLSR
jgi:hypothetical protein